MSEKHQNQTEGEYRPAPWSFNKHPVVSAILWILGTEIQTSPQNNVDDDSKENTLSWKDDHGGHIAEYMSRIQIKRENSTNFSQMMSSAYSDTNVSIRNNRDISPTTVTSTSHVNSKNTEYLNQVNNAYQYNGKSNDEDISNASPQWGFYVSITPPQENYGKSDQSNSTGILKK